jgi:hypothetical protein
MPKDTSLVPLARQGRNQKCLECLKCARVPKVKRSAKLSEVFHRVLNKI